MTEAFQLSTTARDGIPHRFDVEIESGEKAGIWTYRVSTPGCPDFYEARFAAVDGVVQPDVLTANHSAYKGKGITEALFFRVVSDTQLTLESGTNHGQRRLRNESRSLDAERVWRRLFAEERASYDVMTDRFTFVPSGVQPSGSFRRAGVGRQPRYYIKGSYVLDVLFGTTHANDIDICWLDTGGQPTNARVADWMRLCGLLAKPIQLVRVTDLFACDGGGAPIFNIDLWRIEMDGCVYEMDPATHMATKIPAAPKARLGFLPNPPPFALTPSAETNAMLDKALAKMARHPSLFEQATETEILRLKARPIP